MKNIYEIGTVVVCDFTKLVPVNGRKWWSLASEEVVEETTSEAKFVKYVLANTETEAITKYLELIDQDDVDKAFKQIVSNANFALEFTHEGIEYKQKRTEQQITDVTRSIVFSKLIEKMSAEDLSEYCRERMVQINIQ